MEMPAFLPNELLRYQIHPNDEELFAVLVQTPYELLQFFQVACEDETWSEVHHVFMAKTISWMTDETFHDRLFLIVCADAVKSIRKHFSILKPYIPHNISIIFKDKSIEVNSMMLASASPYFTDLVFKESQEKNLTFIWLAHIQSDNFVLIEEYINTGYLADIWKHTPEEIISLLNQAIAWRLEGLVEACEHVLGRYLTKENALDMLIQAHQESWFHLKQKSVNFINELMLGFRLYHPTLERLGFQFLDFEENTLDYFKTLRLFLTDLAFSGSLTNHPTFGTIVKQCPYLILLDLSRTDSFTPYFEQIPRSLQGLNLTQCRWISPETLKQFTEICPNISEFILASNPQLTFSAWGELLKFPEMIKLDISHCYQIENDDFTIILAACSGRLKELSLDKCKKISTNGFHELAAKLPKLTSLNLSQCNVSDPDIVEIVTQCRLLLYLNLSYCDQLTEKGLFALVKHANLLQELDITHCRITPKGLEELRLVNPVLKIISDST